uniref:Uncharacterized protein n=1 Tax=Myotis myotis TaxID=51298 RepID=A0A7J7SBW0_MYOMY|nr:hypothetical protein mMyoMyo1_009463 [Myotis myotis]
MPDSPFSPCMSLGPQILARNWSSEQSGACVSLPIEKDNHVLNCQPFPHAPPYLCTLLPRPTSSESQCAFLFPSSCRISTWPAFLWFWMMSVLSFSCIFEVVVRGSNFRCLPMPPSSPVIL